jgi:hypothetical protein
MLTLLQDSVAFLADLLCSLLDFLLDGVQFALLAEDWFRSSAIALSAEELTFVMGPAVWAIQRTYSYSGLRGNMSSDMHTITLYIHCTRMNEEASR